MCMFSTVLFVLVHAGSFLCHQMLLFSQYQYKCRTLLLKAIGCIHSMNKIHEIIVLFIVLHFLYRMSAILHFNYTLWKQFPSSLHILVMWYSFVWKNRLLVSLNWIYVYHRILIQLQSTLKWGATCYGFIFQ